MPKIKLEFAYTVIVLSILSRYCAAQAQPQPSEEQQQKVRERLEKRQLDRQEEELARRNYQRMHPFPPPPPPPPPKPPFRPMSVEAANRQRDARLAKAQLALEALKSNTDSPEYISAQVELANAYHDEGEKRKASEIYVEAFSNYFKLKSNPTAQKQARESLWKHLGYLSPEKFDSIYPILLKGSLDGRDESSQLARQIAQAVSERNLYWRDNRLDERDFYKRAIETVSARKNSDSKLIIELFQYYLSQLRTPDQYKEAASVFKKISELSANDPVERERNEWDAQQFYVEHNMVDEARQHFDKLPVSRYALSVRGESLARAYFTKGQLENAEKIMRMFYEHPDGNSLNTIDRLLEPMVSGQIHSGNLDKAEKLLSYRVSQSKRFSEDHDAAKWCMKLSQVYLALGKKSESEKLYQQAKISTALMRGDVTKLKEERKRMEKAISKD